jgi:GxxExxY protein
VGVERDDLTGQVIGAAMRVHSALGSGFLESVYVKSLRIELMELGLLAETERPIEVKYKGQSVGRFEADLIVAEALIIEVKAVQTLAQIHEVQLVNYLTATQIEDGLLLNFGAPSLQFKRKRRTLATHS